MRRFVETKAVLERAREARAFTAVVAEIGTAAHALWSHASGTLGTDDATPVIEETIFDLASLTKVLATTTIALQLERGHVLAIDAPVRTVIEEWRADDRTTVTFRDLLEHCSGLPAHRDYFQRVSGTAAFVTVIAREPLEYIPRAKSIYSDLGFITLGAALECLADATLAAQFTAWKTDAGITAPVTYVPPPHWKPMTAITEFDPWRGRLLQGEVHDSNAAAMGGVAAHAGLFGTAAAVGAVARWWLLELRRPDARRYAARSTAPGSSRALGWDTMLPTSSCGPLMPAAALGHTGFTGTSLWIDPSRDLYFVLLTNRVLTTASNQAIQQVRRAFHDAANRELT